MALAKSCHDRSDDPPCRNGVSNVIPLKLGLLPRHREYLSRWLEAGSRMGLFDAEITPSPLEGHDGEAQVAHVLVWVRENPDPAYMLRPHGMRWVLIDHLRGIEIGAYASFELALNTIRPVLPLKDRSAA